MARSLAAHLVRLVLLLCLAFQAGALGAASGTGAGGPVMRAADICGAGPGQDAPGGAGHDCIRCCLLPSVAAVEAPPLASAAPLARIAPPRSLRAVAPARPGAPRARAPPFVSASIA